MSGERQQVRNAVAAYFGGSLVTADSGVAYQGGSLTAYGLGTAYPYEVKGIPDSYYVAGMAAGVGWGSVMGVRLERATKRDSYGGPTSGWRARRYRVTCELVAISQEPHLETAGAGLDDLIDQVHALIYADRTLGTTGGAYANNPGGRLLMQAGENPFGISDQTRPWQPVGGEDRRERYVGEATIEFEALTMVEALCSTGTRGLSRSLTRTGGSSTRATPASSQTRRTARRGSRSVSRRRHQRRRRSHR